MYFSFNRRLYYIMQKLSDWRNYMKERCKAINVPSLVLYTFAVFVDTAIRKLLWTRRVRVYVEGTKAMHRFTSRTPRFDSPRGKKLYGRPGTPGGSTAPICRGTVESSGTGELLFGNIDRFDGRAAAGLVNLCKYSEKLFECKRKNAIEIQKKREIYSISCTHKNA